MPIYYSRTRGTSGGEIVRHADPDDRRTRRRLVKTGHHLGTHRARGSGAARRWATTRVSAWPGIALVLAGACTVLVPLAVVAATVGPPGVSGTSYHPLWPWFDHSEPQPTVRRGGNGVTTPDGQPPVPSGDPTGGPSDGPDAPTNPPARPDVTPSTVYAPPPLPPDATPTRSTSPSPADESPTGSVSPTCPPGKAKGKGHKALELQTPPVPPLIQAPPAK